MYFGKSAKDLTVEEAALIAGILQGNVRQSPYVNMEAALRRRNYTLGRMAEVGYITAADAETAKTKPIVLRGEPSAQPSVAPYFLEEVRKELESRYGAKRLYESGLSAQTALDVRLQEAANRALDEGLRRVDKRRGFRKPRRNVVTEGHAIEAFRIPRWDRAMKAGDIVPAVVLVADGAMIQLRAGDLRVAIDKKGFAWTGKTAGTQLVTRGDLVEARLVTLDDAAHTATATLDQPPAVEGAVLAIDNRTGQIKAMVGGFSFERSKFNRATQALPAGRLRVQADRLHGRDRSRVYADDAADGHAGELPGRRRLAGLHAAELRSQVPGPGHAPPRARGLAQHPGGPGHGAARAPAGQRVRAPPRARVRRCRRTSPSPSAPRRRR